MKGWDISEEYLNRMMEVNEVRKKMTSRTYYHYDIKKEYYFNLRFPFIHYIEYMDINPNGKYWFIKVFHRTVHSKNSPWKK